MGRKLTTKTRLIGIGFALLGALYFAAATGYHEQELANILVVWDGGDPAASTEQSPSFDLLNRLRLGNPLWFID